MCGRFATTTDINKVGQALGLSWKTLVGFKPRYNIAPSQPIVAISNLKASEPDILNWGLVPQWSKSPANSHAPINARLETIQEKPSFKGPFKNQRCLIPANGYYEWQKRGMDKIPHYFSRQDGDTFLFAGIKSVWASIDGSEIHSCAIITMPATNVIKPMHDRAPAIVARNHIEQWMDFSYYRGSDLVGLLAPIGDQEIKITQVKTYVNNPSNDDSQCTQSVEKDSHAT